MLEYGAAYFEQNEIALAELREKMSPAAWALAERMAAEDADADEAEQVDA
jgi:hypothetical protein